jgi:hypothetical protein
MLWLLSLLDLPKNSLVFPELFVIFCDLMWGENLHKFIIIIYYELDDGPIF